MSSMSVGSMSMGSAGLGPRETSAEAVLDQIADGCRELAERAGPESGLVALEQAQRLVAALDQAEAALAVLVARVDATGVFKEAGFASVVAWLRGLGMRHGRAGERAGLARQLGRLPRTAELLAVGAVSADQASVICQAVTRLEDADAHAAENILLAMIEQGCTVQQISRAGDRITDLIHQQHGQGEPPDSRRGFKRSWLARSKSLDGGCWVKGWFHAEYAAAFDQIIGPLAKPKAEGDDRDPAERTADALLSVVTTGNKNAGVTIIIDLAAYTTATHSNATTSPNMASPDTASPGTTDSGTTTGFDEACGSGAAPGGPFSYSRRRDRGTPPPRAADHDPRQQQHRTDREERDSDLAEHGRDREEHGHDREELGGDGEEHDSAREEHGCERDETAQGPGQEGERAHRVPRRPVAARLLDGTPISVEQARRIALSAGINTLLLGHGGVPLYLGRTVRFATPAQRKALLAHYETCCVTGCPIPAHLCEIHHLDGGWKLGVPTDIDRLAPACGWHNRWIDDHPDRITQQRDAQGRAIITIQPLRRTSRLTGTRTGPARSERQTAGP